MAIHNDILYNAALCAFVGACVEGRSFTTTEVTAVGASLLAAAQSFATSVDALIAEDATITTGGGDASQLGDAALVSDIISAEEFKALLLLSCCKSVLAGRWSTDATAGAYATQAAAAVALYNATKTGITNAA